MRRPLPLLIIGVLIVVVAGAFSALTGFVVNWLWFDSLGFTAVFFTIWRTQVLAFIGAAALSAVFLAVNGLVAVRTPALRLRGLRLMRRNGGASDGLPVFVEFAADSLPWRLIVLADLFALAERRIFWAHRPSLRQRRRLLRLHPALL